MKSRDLFEAGWQAAGQYSAHSGDEYVNKVQESIQSLEDQLNSFRGYETGIGQLQGDMAEFWHSGTFNINSSIKESSYHTTVDRSHDFASADITTNFGLKYGLKYYQTGKKSAQQQAISYFQRYCKYKDTSGRNGLSFIDYLKEKGISDTDVMNDPIYAGQMRLIPSDQLNEAISFLKLMIAKEELTRPEQVKRYKDTLENLTTRISAPDGTESIELSRQQAEELARLAKLGEVDLDELGISTKELIKIDDIIMKGAKAGLTSAAITLVIKSMPDLCNCIKWLVNTGQIRQEDLENLGNSAVSGGAEGFLRGFISATIVSACDAGKLGEMLKGIDPSVIGALTTIVISTIKDSIAVARGSMDQYELTANLTKNIFVSACAVGAGLATQTLFAIPGAYLLGNFVGSIVGAFVYQASNAAIISLCVNNGYTLFGLVDQNYTLPDSVLKEIGIEVWDSIKHTITEQQYKEHTFSTHTFEEHNPEMIKILRRGVISVNRIAFVN